MGIAKTGGELAHATIMFTDLCDSTYIAAQMEPEQYFALLVYIRDKFLTIAKKYGAENVRIDGDGFIFLFGYPRVRENCAKLAVQAALEIHECLETINKGNVTNGIHLEVHTGIHSGIIFVKKGDIERGKFEVIGTPTNVTARLCDYAGPGEIVVSNECLGREKACFKVAQESIITLLKLNRRIAVSRVVGLNESLDSKQIFSNHAVEFGGRETEMAWLERFVFDTKNACKIAIIQAEAGLGKSRLLNEFANNLSRRKIGVHHSICDDSLGTKPFQPILHLVRSIVLSDFGYNLRDIPETANPLLQSVRAMIQAIDDTTKTNNEMKGLTNKIEQCLKSLCQTLSPQPLIMVVDDWQWVDAVSKNIVERLADCGPKNLKFILASRNLDSVFIDMNDVQCLQLKPLSPDATNTAIKKIIPSVEPFTLRRIQKYSGGNPLFLEELCHAIKDSRFAFENRKTGSWLNSLIFTRFSQLSDELAQIVKIAAVIGHIIPEWLLRALSPSQIGALELQNLRETDFLYPAETRNYLRFKHGITRDVIYEMIGVQERQRLHREIIEKLLERAASKRQALPHDKLAFHNAKCGDMSSSVRHSLLAGDSALRNSALDKAQAHFKHILEQILSGSVNVDFEQKILHKYALACVVDSNWEQIPILQQFLEYSIQKTDDKTIGRAQYWLAYIYYALGEPNKSIFHFNAAKTLAEKCNDISLLSQINLNLGQAYASGCEYKKCYEYLDGAIDKKTSKTLDANDKVSISYALSRKAFALADQGKFQSAYAIFDQASELILEQKHFATSSILNQLSVAKLWEGDFDETIRLSTQVFDLANIVRSRYHYAMARTLISTAEFYKTGDPTCVRKMATATNWMRAGGSQQCISLNYSYLADAYSQTEDWANTRLYAARALQRARKGDRLGESLAYRALARMSEHQDTRYSFQDYITKAMISAKRRGSTRDIEKTDFLLAKTSGTVTVHTHNRPELFYI